MMMRRRRRRRRRRIRRAFGPGRVRSWVCWFVTPLIFPPQWEGPWGQNTTLNDCPPLVFSPLLACCMSRLF